MSCNVSKQALRNSMKNLLNDFLCSSENKAIQHTFNLQTSNYIRNFNTYITSNTVLAYYPLNNEASCISIIENALSVNKKLFLPRVDGEKIHFIYCNSINEKEEFNKSSYGILEPTGMDYFDIDRLTVGDSVIVFVPGLAFTTSGKRLGRGKAYYDRFLNELKNSKAIINNKVDLTLVGLCYSFQICDDLPTENHDIMMDYVLCEKGLISCK